MLATVWMFDRTDFVCLDGKEISKARVQIKRGLCGWEPAYVWQFGFLHPFLMCLWYWSLVDMSQPEFDFIVLVLRGQIVTTRAFYRWTASQIFEDAEPKVWNLNFLVWQLLPQNQKKFVWRRNNTRALQTNVNTASRIWFNNHNQSSNKSCV